MSIYHKDVSHIKKLDPYRLQELYDMHPCAEHVVKKLLVAGKRSGGKSLDTDIADCIWTLQRWQEMRAEDAGTVEVPRWATHTLTDSEGRTVFVGEGGLGEYFEYGGNGEIVSVFNRNNYVDGTLVKLEARPQ